MLGANDGLVSNLSLVMGVAGAAADGRTILLTKATMPPADALFAATRNAADLIGASDKIGSIQPGRYADIVAVDGDPMKDVNEFEKVQFVMKGGVVYKKDGEATAAR